ncbi:MAG: MarR family winged helix-turn-helix transcriptional regulator [Spongiibacteraceae bacterium]
MAQKKGPLFAEVARDISRLNGLLQQRGERTASTVGLTSARWSTLGILERAKQPLTVPEIARLGGQARQGVQRLVNAMVTDELLAYQDNPGHATSKKVAVTDKGRQIYYSLRERQETWSERVGKDMTFDDLKTLAQLLGRLLERLDK